MSKKNLVAYFDHRPLFHLGDARRHADGHARSGEAPAGYGFADEIGDHGLGDLEVRDDAVLQGPDRPDALRGAAQILLGLPSHGQNGVVAHVQSHDRRLVQNDSFLRRVQQGVGRTQIHSQILAEKTKQFTEKHEQFPLRLKTRISGAVVIAAMFHQAGRHELPQLVLQVQILQKKGQIVRCHLGEGFQLFVDDAAIFFAYFIQAGKIIAIPIP